ncbi:NUDIX hydrolase [Acetobacter orleanensis]|uniref:DNA mismatch repair protein MutT n=1 Tax=Acetobacter orleanensis TaxID=104099 RepID=A0A4Y3TR77_9PROT|nr:NUDIX domain-containing protein [Acetobacter orleanensis]KXV66883.1 DNA mismatch repair protein MutT [Acetobacter orleanensis]PCD78392.1 NUDIX domain-containing protein [Acetobacter orleanensis]GAN69348.1 phosphohydrolase [Acetobacter orleanensis JCM 7639]GBR22060.1 phosphohydrolase [Acetobacter orleanensis NRIC 0473]GEB83969.1 DNA mismatch repair protein MutT [Acetobacter orleanensis]
MTSASKLPVIHIATALIFNEQGQILLVRKHGSRVFMQAGGKIDAGETAVQAVTRELNEELGITVTLKEDDFLGSFTAPAANEPGYLIQAEVFQMVLSAPVAAQAEIAEIIWVDPSRAPQDSLAPLTRDTLMPLAAKLLRSGAIRN